MAETANLIAEANRGISTAKGTGAMPMSAYHAMQQLAPKADAAAYNLSIIHASTNNQLAQLYTQYPSELTNFVEYYRNCSTTGDHALVDYELVAKALEDDMSASSKPGFKKAGADLLNILPAPTQTHTSTRGFHC